MDRDSRFRPLLRFLRRLPGAPGAGDPSDSELLARFAGRRDEAAFALLVDRYGSMVLGLCRRVLRNHHDAEDAFQATFLVLARKAGSIRRPHLLGNWLYGVAYCTALKARVTTARRRSHELATPSRLTAPAVDTTEAELKPILDDEVNRLPEKYRAAFILCCLRGRTNEEAARQLRCPVGTVQSRLARARQRLRTRLVRRGVTLASGGWAAVGRGEAPAAVVPDTLRESVVAVAASFADATGLVSTSSVMLARGVLQAMFLTKLRLAGVAVLMLSLVSASAGLVALRTQAQPAQQPVSAAPLVTKTDKKEVNVKLQALLNERLNAARTELDARTREFEAGRGTLDMLFGASRRLVEAQRDMNGSKEDLLTALKDHVERMKQIEKINQDRFDAGRLPIYDLAESTYYRTEAEIWLERAKAK
jgi:RNA polymerase sigma factor (sigma-70 family)